MEWRDEGIVLSTRAYGESGAIVELFTREHGRHLGLVRGGAGRRHKGMLQPGNGLAAHWRARLSEHLGTYTAEMLKPRAGSLMEDSFSLVGLSAACAVAEIIPEREAHPALYEGFELLLDTMEDPDIWPAIFRPLGAGAAPGARLRSRSRAMRRDRQPRRSRLCFAPERRCGVPGGGLALPREALPPTGFSARFASWRGHARRRLRRLSHHRPFSGAPSLCAQRQASARRPHSSRRSVQSSSRRPDRLMPGACCTCSVEGRLRIGSLSSNQMPFRS